MQMLFKINNGGYIKVFQAREDGPVYVDRSYGGENDLSYRIEPGDFVMLLNYYRNCKLGREDSEYIKPSIAEICLKEDIKESKG